MVIKGSSPRETTPREVLSSILMTMKKRKSVTQIRVSILGWLDELEKWQREREQKGLVENAKSRISKVFNGAGNLVNKYAKRRLQMEK